MSMQWFKHVVANAKHVQHHIIKHSYCLITMSYAPTCQLTIKSPKITTIMNITRSAKLSDVPSRQVVIVNIAVTVNCRPDGVHLSALLGRTRSKVGERGNVIAIGWG